MVQSTHPLSGTEHVPPHPFAVPHSTPEQVGMQTGIQVVSAQAGGGEGSGGMMVGGISVGGMMSSEQSEPAQGPHAVKQPKTQVRNEPINDGRMFFS